MWLALADGLLAQGVVGLHRLWLALADGLLAQGGCRVSQNVAGPGRWATCTGF